MSHHSEGRTGATRQEQEQEQEQGQNEDRIANPSTQNVFRANRTGTGGTDSDSILEIMVKRSRYEARQREHDNVALIEADREESISKAVTGILTTDALTLQQDVARIQPIVEDRNPTPNGSITSGSDHQIMKLVAERSRCASSLIGSVQPLPAVAPESETRWEDPSVLESIQPLPAPTPNPGPDTNPENYSLNSKKRIAGPIQPGAFGAAPGEQPLRVQSLRYSAFNYPAPDLMSDLASGSEELGCQIGSEADNDEGDNPQPILGRITETDEESPIQWAPDQNLVEAQAVQTSQKPIVEANEVDPTMEEAKQQRRTGLLFGSLAGLCMVVCAVVLLVLFAAGIFNSSVAKQAALGPPGAPVMAPSLAPTSHFVLLPKYSLEAIEDKPSSPQARGYHWLEDDPMLATYSNSRLLQRYALAVFYYATGGDQWFLNINWLSYESDECGWYHKHNDNQSIACDAEGNLLTLELTNNGLAGTLPPELAILTNLEILDVADNTDLHGTVPTEVGLMTLLSQLILDSNELSGPIPTVIGYLSKLEFLYTHTNHITGTIPTELGLLTQMKDLEVGLSPTMTGTLPSELGLLTKMTYLFAAYSSFNGTIPSEILSVSTLWEGIVIANNSLDGTIPTQLGQLSASDKVSLHSNSFSGPIPSEVGNLRNTTELLLMHNYLTGTIPNQLFKLSQMKKLILGSNSLSGTIPTNIGTLAGALSLTLGLNKLCGTIPTQVGRLSSLEWLSLESNNLSGSLPSELGLMENLIWLFVEMNSLSGILPPELFHQHKIGDRRPPLEILGVSSNDLTGTIPTEIVYSSSLAFFSLQDTLLSSTLPPTLCNLEELHFTCSYLLCGCDCNCSMAGSDPNRL